MTIYIKLAIFANYIQNNLYKSSFLFLFFTYLICYNSKKVGDVIRHAGN